MIRTGDLVKVGFPYADIAQGSGRFVFGDNGSRVPCKDAVPEVCVCLGR